MELCANSCGMVALPCSPCGAVGKLTKIPIAGFLFVDLQGLFSGM
jgi:hypothetical protein